jgi:hypothetical protein
MLQLSEAPPPKRKDIARGAADAIDSLVLKIQQESKAALDSLNALKARIAAQVAAVAALKARVDAAASGGTPSKTSTQLAVLVQAMREAVRKFVGGHRTSVHFHPPHAPSAPSVPAQKASLRALLDAIDAAVHNERSALLVKIQAAERALRERTDALAAAQAGAANTPAAQADASARDAEAQLKDLEAALSEEVAAQSAERTVIAQLREFFRAEGGGGKAAGLAELLEFLDEPAAAKCDGEGGCILPLLSALEERMDAVVTSAKEAVEAQKGAVGAAQAAAKAAAAKGGGEAEKKAAAAAEAGLVALRGEYEQREGGWKAELALVDSLEEVRGGGGGRGLTGAEASSRWGAQGGQEIKKCVVC